ncbi:hypothetical protein I0C86_10515 [Plantactinospora sp. S1510]|uniref:DUF3558 domain-containing protein n=1 Tax=Plantactinospora alkalitolerans TaxID=2789879 RepID=A0ABS0GT90_9ACTN|nr:hypothetical protein [Plantactinospora alkalitolerans]MBF9129403.1 hypothetical protein [Plantactinospora alkalitolerans]
MRTSARSSVASLLLLGVLACSALSGCGGSDEPDQAPSASTSTPPATTGPAPTTAAPTTAAQAASGPFSKLPACNVLPEEMRGTFQGDMLKIDQEPKASEKWTAGAACLGMLAGRTVALTISLRLFPAKLASSGAATFAKSEAGKAEAVTGWGDEAWWSKPTCSLVVRYSNIVATFAQRAPTDTCRPDVERLAKAFADQHLTS